MQTVVMEDKIKYTYSCVNFKLIESAQGIIIQAPI